MKLRSIYWIGALLLSTTLSAQTIDHRTYKGVNFNTLTIGTPVEGKPGYQWTHNGTSWEHICVNPYKCDPGPPTGVFTLPTYMPGVTYTHAYPSMVLQVIAVTQDGDKIIVTGRYVGQHRPGMYYAFVAGTEPWVTQ